MNTTSSPTPPPVRYCIRTADGERVCEIVEGPISDYRFLFRMFVVRAVKGRLNPINRMMVPEWKLSNKVTS